MRSYGDLKSLSEGACRKKTNVHVMCGMFLKNHRASSKKMHRTNPLQVGVFAFACLSILTIFAVSSSDLIFGNDSVTLIEEARGLMTQKLEETNKCGASCLAKRRRIAAQMKALQRQINDDYHDMIHFGQKAGYVPPVKSIRQQVMDGSLLGGSDDAAAPPPFSPNLHAASSEDASSENDSLDNSESHRSRKESELDTGRVIRPRDGENIPAKHNYMRTDGSTESKESNKRNAREIPHLGKKMKFHSHQDSDSARLKWKKLFSFMKSKPDDESPKHMKPPRTTIPSAVRRAIQRALSFATTPHQSRTEKAGVKLLGLERRRRGGVGAGNPLDDKFLKSYFGDGS